MQDIERMNSAGIIKTQAKTVKIIVFIMSKTIMKGLRFVNNFKWDE